MVANAERIAHGGPVFAAMGNVLITGAPNTHQAHGPELSACAAFDVNGNQRNASTSGIGMVEDDSGALIDGMTNTDPWNQSFCLQ